METNAVKFRCEWIQAAPPKNALIAELNVFRQELFSMGLIGIDELGYGYGNLSKRLLGSEFIITGTQTGGISILENTHYTNIIDYSFENNSVVCNGSVKASSETLTHAAIYQVDPNILCIAHIHHLKAWEDLLDKLPTTADHVEYGTTEMADEIIRLYTAGAFKNDLAFVMGGHKEGFVVFGTSIQETRERVSSIFKTYI